MRGHRVHAQAVDVVAVEPEERAGDQEVAHLVAAVVEDQGAPVLVLALAGVGVLVEGGAVEPRQAAVVLGEVGGHPVEITPMPLLVAVVHEVLKSSGVPKRLVGAK
jgi:hypothetical protein